MRDEAVRKDKATLEHEAEELAAKERHYRYGSGRCGFSLPISPTACHDAYV